MRVFVTLATVIVPSLLRPLCAGATRLEVDGATLAAVLRALDARCPGFYDRVVDNGAVRPELAIAMNGEILHLPLHEPIAPGAELTIVPAIGGG